MMKHVFFAGALAALASLSAVADQDYQLTDGRIVFDVEGELTDVGGVYGVAGRALRVSSLTAAPLEGDAVRDDHTGGFTLDIAGRYRLSYTLNDAATGAVVGSDSFDVGFGLSAFGDEFNTYYNGKGTLAQSGGTGSIFGQRPASSGWTQPLWNAGYFPVGTSYGEAQWADDRLSFTGSDGFLHTFTLAPEFGGGTIQGVAQGYLQLQPVPEPETYALLALGLGGIAFARRRRAG